MLPNKKKCYKKTFFGLRPSFGRYLIKKQPKLTNEENWQNPRR